jgi:tRNA-dihydrouridine synthase 1
MQNLKTPVSVKIRIFPELERTLAYAQMLERAGASLLAVHGRTREQKDAKAFRADWDAMKAVKAALSIPVLGNGDVRSRQDAQRLMEYTGVDGVLSAEPLLDDPGLFRPSREESEVYTYWDRFKFANEYLEWVGRYPVHPRMMRVRISAGALLFPCLAACRRFDALRSVLGMQS